MAEKVTWSFSIQVAGGPNVGGTSTLIAEAYDKVQVDLEDNTTDKVVNLAPDGAGTTKLIAIIPKKPDAKLTYKRGADNVMLDGPHLLIGDGAVSLLALNGGSLKFTNTTGAVASIDVFVARDATP